MPHAVFRAVPAALIAALLLLISGTPAPDPARSVSGLVPHALLTGMLAHPSALPNSEARHSPTDVAPAASRTNLTWPMLLHDQGRTGANVQESVLAVGNTSGLQQLWDFSLNKVVSGSTVVANGSVYFGAWNGNLYAVNAYNGTQEWSTSLGGKWTPPLCNEPGIAATPALWNGTLFIGGANPWLYAVNASTGTILWHVDLANVTGSSTPWSAHKVWSSAVVYNGSLYVGIASGCDSPLVRGALFQIALSDHNITHTFWTIASGSIGPGIWSSPTIDPVTNTVWVTTGNEGTSYSPYARALVELNASNISQVLGYIQEGAALQDLDFGDGATIFHSSNGTPMVVAINKNGIAYAFKESDLKTDGTGPTAWTRSLFTASSDYAPPAFDGQFLYIGTVMSQQPAGPTYPGSVLAVYPDNGTVKWWVRLSAAVYGGITYANGLVWVGDTAQDLVALNAADGSVVTTQSPGAQWSDPVVLNGEVIVTSGALYGSSGDVTAYGLPLAANASATRTVGTAATTYVFDLQVSGGVLPDNATWDFGDGSLGYGARLSHSFTTAGTYSVNVTITDARGVSVRSTLSVIASAPLSASAYEPTNPMNLGAGAFIGVRPVGGTLPYTYAWSGLPPGSMEVNASADLFLVQPYYEGLYHVSVAVSSPSGQQFNVTFAPLYVDGPLAYQLIASPPSGVLPLTVRFSALSSFPNATGNYLWDFGDGTSSTALTPSHTFVLAAVNPVTLTVRYAGGSFATATLSVAGFNPLSLVGPEPKTVDLGASVSLLADASGGAGAYTYTWSGLPGGCPSVNNSLLACSPTEAGAFAVTVSVRDPLGGTAEAYSTLLVNAPLSLSAIVTSIGAPVCGSTPPHATVHLSSVPQGGQPPYDYAWTGPNGTSATGPDSTWTVAAPGIYDFRVNVTDGFGFTAATAVSATTPAATCTPATAQDFWSSPSGTVAIVLGILVVLVVTSALVVRMRRR